MHGRVRAGRTREQKTDLLKRIVEGVSQIANVPKVNVWGYVSELPPSQMNGCLSAKANVRSRTRPSDRPLNYTVTAAASAPPSRKPPKNKKAAPTRGAADCRGSASKLLARYAHGATAGHEHHPIARGKRLIGLLRDSH